MTSANHATAPRTPAPAERTGWTPGGATIVGLLASGALLVALYRSLDVRLVGEALLRADKAWLVFSVGMILPITALRAMRFFWVAPPGALPSVGEAFRLTLVASALNVFVPAKAGDLVKSYFVATRSATSAGVSIAIVIYERLCDLFGLITWCILGWLVARPQETGLPALFWWLLAAIGTMCVMLISSDRVAMTVRVLAARALPRQTPRRLREVADEWPHLLQILRGRRVWIVLYSLLLWLTQLVQIWLFTVALSAQVPFTVSTSLSAVALMAGQLPFTFAGLGARDVALVVLLSRYMAPESAAAMGILIATRGLLPPLLGAPLMGPYVSSVLGEARRWRKAAQVE